MKHKKINGKTVIGLTEDVIIHGKDGKKTVIARIDTGATKSSIDAYLAAELRLGPIVKTKLVKSAHGMKLRPVIRVNIKFADITKSYFFTIADRSHMKYRVLIGQNILKKGFLIDPSKK